VGRLVKFAVECFDWWNYSKFPLWVLLSALPFSILTGYICLSSSNSIKCSDICCSFTASCFTAPGRASSQTLLKCFHEGLGGGWNVVSHVKAMCDALSLKDALYKTAQTRNARVFLTTNGKTYWGSLIDS